VLEDLKKLSGLSWRYQRWSTTATVATVSVLSGLAARALMPRSTPPAGPFSVLAASAGAYVVLRLGSASGWSKRLKHEWLDRFGGDVDDAQTWLLGTLAGVGTLVLLRAARKAAARLLARVLSSAGKPEG
jgi:hypothetical protein